MNRAFVYHTRALEVRIPHEAGLLIVQFIPPRFAL